MKLLTLQLLLLIYCSFLALVPTNSAASNSSRKALVIGNGSYKSSPLKNPVNDASDIAAELKGFGFTVTKLLNGSQSEMRKAIREFGRDLKKGGVGLFYYAGHGMQVKGVNYLVPIGADIAEEDEVQDYAVDAGMVLRKMQSAENQLNMVFLDACRDNPFSRSFRNTQKGLAQMDAPSGSMISYATAPGSVAADGRGRNGVFTQNLLDQLRKAGTLELAQLMKKVGKGVQDDTGKAQVPWVTSSITGDFYFNTGGGDVNIIIPPQTDISLPPKASDIGGFEERIQKRQAAQMKWAEWQGQMDENFAKVEQYDESNLLTSDEKVVAWNNFLATFSTDNPHSGNDEQYRSKASYRLSYWQGQKIAMAKRPPKAQAATSSSKSNSRSYTDSTTGMEFVYVPEGCFQMGDTFGDGYSDEKPVHEVCVDGFYIGKYEVTQGQWQKLMGSNPSRFKNGTDYPVEKVSWEDAQEYIQKIGSQGGKRFRLPTEAEWEYACRSGGKKEKYCGGSDVDSLAWYTSNSGSKTHQVGTKQANGLGIYDMSGNVYEWTEDWYDKKYYSSSPKNNPKGASSVSYRVNRGGSWFDLPRYVRSAFRYWINPGLRFNSLGFRLVLPPGQQ